MPAAARAQKTHRFDGGGDRYLRSFYAPWNRVCYGSGEVSRPWLDTEFPRLIRPESGPAIEASKTTLGVTAILVGHGQPPVCCLDNYKLTGTAVRRSLSWEKNHKKPQRVPGFLCCQEGGVERIGCLLLQRCRFTWRCSLTPFPVCGITGW